MEFESEREVIRVRKRKRTDRKRRLKGEGTEFLRLDTESLESEKEDIK